MSAAGRTIRLAEVSPGDVRESGLLKDLILLRNIAESQSADNTMLGLAVQDLKAADQAWRTHRDNTDVGWYRNPSSGRNALAVPYEFGDKYQLMHPDFLFWHDDGGNEHMTGIVDPHRHDLADTSAKWAALARYAHDHADRVRRCLAVIKVGDKLRALDLTANDIADRIGVATNKSLVEAVFESEGMDYP